MTRVIAGTAKGRVLKVPAQGTRPTSDRVRESVFSSLDHLLETWDGISVLDLYAGSGAFAIEALSRGAREATLVDNGRDAAAVATANLEAIGLTGRVVHRSVDAFLHQPRNQEFDIVFIDPPYDLSNADIVNTLGLLADGAWLSNGAVVLVERSRRTGEFSWPSGFSEPTVRKFGDTMIFRGIWYVS